MEIFDTAGWILMAALWLVVVLYVYRIVRRIWKDRLVRCPESGAVTLIRTAPRTGDAKEPEVEHCALWEDREGCAQGCLARHPETVAGHRVNLQSLRPFSQ